MKNLVPRSREDFRTHHTFVAGLKIVLVLLQDLCTIRATYLIVSFPQAMENRKGRWQGSNVPRLSLS